MDVRPGSSYWNRERNHRERIYISYDSTNKHCQAGDVELAEFGHEKDKQKKPVINYSIAYFRKIINKKFNSIY